MKRQTKGTGPSRALLAAALATATLPSAAQAPDETRPAPADAILVLDASGSMWAQIDGVPRITIAREVVSGLLDDLPAERRIGLVAYGHNRKGDCNDIETLVEVGTDRDAIREAIAGINPKGKTPMTAAVRQAAERLKYSEDPATVILVSDGIETCGLDPCAIATTLEQTGVALTVHTVGFGLGAGEQAAKAQLQCIADNTGGRALLANDAGELADALRKVSTLRVSDDVEPQATVAGPDSAPAGSDVRVRWTGPDEAGDFIAVAAPGDSFSSNYTYTRKGSPLMVTLPDQVGGLELRYVSGKTRDVLARQPIETTPVQATLEVPATAAAGSTIQVGWSGPDYMQDYIAVASPDAEGPSSIDYTYTSAGSPLQLDMPEQPGTYEVRYILRQSRGILARATIDVR